MRVKKKGFGNARLGCEDTLRNHCDTSLTPEFIILIQVSWFNSKASYGLGQIVVGTGKNKLVITVT